MLILKRKFKKKLGVFLAALCLSLLAGFKSPLIWQDLQTYQNYYEYGVVYNSIQIYENVQDPLFTMVNRFFSSLGLSFEFTILLICFLTLFLKLFSLDEASNRFYPLLLLYLSNLYILHDYIQIRVALAIALALCAIYLIKNKYLRLLFFVASFGIHASIIIIIVAYYSRVYSLKNRFNFLISLTLIVIFSILFVYFSKSGFFIDNRAEYYLNNDKFSINTFTPRPILQAVGVFFILFYSKYKISFEVYVAVIGVIVFYSTLSMSPVVASRFFDITSLFFLIALSKVYKNNIVLFSLFILTFLVGLYHLFISPSAYLAEFLKFI